MTSKKRLHDAAERKRQMPFNEALKRVWSTPAVPTILVKKPPKKGSA